MGTERSLLYAFVGVPATGITGSAIPVAGRDINPAAPLGRAAIAPYVIQLVPNTAGGVQELGTAPENADNQAPGVDRPVYLARLQGFDGVNYDRLRTVPDVGDGLAALPGGVGALAVAARLQAETGGAGFDALVVGSAGVQSEVVTGTTRRGLVVQPLAEFSVHADPAAAAVATITKAAGGLGNRHVCRSIHATLNAGAAATGILKVYLRDGAAGVGAILWSASLQAPAAGHEQISLSGLAILGSANTAMTLEFSAAGGAGSQENVSLTGYSLNN